MRERKTQSGRSVSTRAVRRARRSGNSLFIARLMLADEGGQVLPWVVVMMLTVLGVAALVVDCGRAMVAQRELQAATDSMALVAAQELGITSSYQTDANNFSAVSGGKNTYQGLTIATHTITPVCLATVTGWGVKCTTSGGLATAANAVVVTQTTSVPTMFAGVLGKPTRKPERHLDRDQEPAQTVQHRADRGLDAVDGSSRLQLQQRDAGAVRTAGSPGSFLPTSIRTTTTSRCLPSRMS